MQPPFDSIAVSCRSAGQTCFEWWTNNIIEQKCAVNQHDEADDLEPFKAFPADGEGDEPDEKRTTGVDSAS